jgi:hypothetical protein
MIRSGAIVMLLPYLAVAAFVVVGTIAALVKFFRREPYTPPDVPDGRDARKDADA